MSKSNWKPKNDFVGVPGKGFIKAEDFKDEDLQALIDRAKNRKIDVHSFLLKAGLVPDQPQVELFEEPGLEPEKLEPEKEEGPVVVEQPKAKPVKEKTKSGSVHFKKGE